MRLFSYVVARDYGFAPNPFFGVCTLATCKPRIRKAANIGDWVVGTGSRRQNREGFLIFVTQVGKVMTFNQYWNCKQFQNKKPNLRGSEKQAYGDNIYFKDKKKGWRQLNSHHSHPDGTPNLANICRDTSADKVLISNRYIYRGKLGLKIPRQIRYYRDCGCKYDICALRGHKCNFPQKMVTNFIEWIETLSESGYVGEPLNWSR